VRVLVGLVGLAAIALAVWRWPSAPDETTGPRPERRRSSTATSPPPAPALPPLVASLADTETDGTVRLGEDGELVVDLELRRLFDYYLSSHGEEDPATTRTRLHAALDARLGPAAARDAKDVLDRYLAYREATKSLTDSGDLRTNLGKLVELRRRVLGERVATAFFATEEAEVELALARQQALEDVRLGDAERAAALAKAEAAAPAETEAAYVESTSVLAGMEAEQALVARGAGAAEIHEERVRRFGAEAAERLHQLDERRAAWKARVDEFRAAKTKLEAELGSGAGPAIEARMSRDFTPEEQIRIRALTR
jgi:lipase chaperone LimK